MEKVIIVRYAEIHLKGKNRGYFERVFCVNLEKALKGLRHELRRTSGRYLVAGFQDRDAEEICERIARVFGDHSYSLGYRVPNDLDSIFEAAKIVSRKSAQSCFGNFLRSKWTYASRSMSYTSISGKTGLRLCSENLKRGRAECLSALLQKAFCSFLAASILPLRAI